MSVFESLNNTTDKAQDLGENYFNVSQDYFKLKIFQQIGFSISLFAKIFFIGSLIILAFLFMAIAGSIAIGEALENDSLGYLIVGGLALILGYIAFLLRKRIEKIILIKLSEKFFN